VVGGAGEDILSGGGGNDRIDARDGTPDLIDCGPGFDVVTKDPQDQTRNCERSAG
jgi:Ca2+-binding RTX toxin-like protein